MKPVLNAGLLLLTCTSMGAEQPYSECSGAEQWIMTDLIHEDATTMLCLCQNYWGLLHVSV